MVAIKRVRGPAALLALLLGAATLTHAQPAAQGPARTPAENYNEPLRPQVHFSPAHHWMNDPNGPIFFGGEYHLFYQSNPAGDTPGNVSWGHAVSPDLLHWRELPIAIPATPTEQAFTGSVVIDEHNTSGLCQPEKLCLVAIYTAHHDATGGRPQREAQALAVSQDNGLTWQRYAGNPVLDLNLPNFRDPSVSWSRKTNSWLMAVALPDNHQVLFFTSPDLKRWTKLSTFGPAGATTQLDPKAQWECPTLLHLGPENGTGTGLWALKVGLNPGALQGGSGEQYFLGNFDGKTFTQDPRSGSHGWTDYGKDSYCSIPFNNRPGFRIVIGWMDNWQYADKLPTSPWRGQMTLPHMLFEHETPNSVSLLQDLIVEPLRIGKPHPIRHTIPVREFLPEILTPGDMAPSLANTTSPVEFLLRLNPADASHIGVRFFSDLYHYVEVAFSLVDKTLTVDRTHAGGLPMSFLGPIAPSVDDLGSDVGPPEPPGFTTKTSAPIDPKLPLDLHIVIDRSSIEVLAQDGTISITNLLLPPPGQGIHLETVRGGGTHPARITGSYWPLKSIWPTPVAGHRPASKPSSKP